MTESVKTQWVTETHNAMDEAIDTILRAAGYVKHQYLCFSMYETVQDPVKDDMSDWVVKRPDFAARFAAGKVQFVSSNYGDDPVLSPVYTNPTWADVVVEGERSCRARGAPQLDHVFLESVELEKVVGGVARYAMHFGS